jgi:hypothetical protein
MVKRSVHTIQKKNESATAYTTTSKQLTAAYHHHHPSPTLPTPLILRNSISITPLKLKQRFYFDFFVFEIEWSFLRLKQFLNQ